MDNGFLCAYWIEVKESGCIPYLVIAKTYKEAIDFMNENKFGEVVKGELLSDFTEVSDEYCVFVAGIKV